MWGQKWQQVIIHHILQRLLKFGFLHFFVLMHKSSNYVGIQVSIFFFKISNKSLYLYVPSYNEDSTTALARVSLTCHSSGGIYVTLVESTLLDGSSIFC